MDVFIIPMGGERYELYCEPAHEATEPEREATGRIGRLRAQVMNRLREAEARQRSGAPAPEVSGRFARLQERAIAWTAQRIAEQRLLWNLRGATTAVVAHPPDMTSETVIALVRRILQRDYDRHRRWLVVDGILFVVTFVGLGPLFLLIPGVANLPALYFGFRVVGHFLSMRGARNGLGHVSWSTRICPPLGELRALATLGDAEREARLKEIAGRLQLHHLPSFFARVA